MLSVMLSAMLKVLGRLRSRYHLCLSLYSIPFLSLEGILGQKQLPLVGPVTINFQRFIQLRKVMI